MMREMKMKRKNMGEINRDSLDRSSKKIDRFTPSTMIISSQKTKLIIENLSQATKTIKFNKNPSLPRRAVTLIPTFKTSNTTPGTSANR
mmetsp:Transcript_19726/g.14457  ORF Transcript_19726/g.14457 Transcript_19726/m.14457 type:complete len:89 (+) Transcript_19726:101-367(+)